MGLRENARSASAVASAMPRPAPHRAGSRVAVFLAILAVLTVGGAAYWLTREEDTRLRWIEGASRFINDTVADTPLAGVGDLLRPAPVPPPTAVTHPSTMPGTLAGQTVQAPVSGPAGADATSAALSGNSVEAGADNAAAGAGAPSVAAAMPSAAALPKVKEDSRVRGSFVDDLAAWLVSRYRHGSNGGSLQVSVQALNQRYGDKLAAGAEGGGRAGLLRYAFQPSMLQGLYGLYAERFLEALNRQAAAKGLTPGQSGDLRMALAGRLVTLASALEGVAAVPDLASHLTRIEKASQQVLDANAQMSEATFALDELRSAHASKAQIATASLRVEGLAARYRRASDNRDAAQRALAAAVRQGGGRSLDDDSLLFLAHWVRRRLRDDPQALPTVRAAAAVLRDLARRSAQPLARPQGRNP